MKIERIPPKVGYESLVGIINAKYPLGWGNYFGFWPKYRCINMWSENLREWARRNQATDIEVAVFSDKWAFVIDERVPADWLYPELCFTGGPRPTAGEMKEILDYAGRPYSDWLCGCEADGAPAGLGGGGSYTDEATNERVHYKLCCLCKTRYETARYTISPKKEVVF